MKNNINSYKSQPLCNFDFAGKFDEARKHAHASLAILTRHLPKVSQVIYHHIISSSHHWHHHRHRHHHHRHHHHNDIQNHLLLASSKRVLALILEEIAIDNQVIVITG